jgi:hypothetical protein
VYGLNCLQRLKQLNEEVERKLAATSRPHIHVATAPDLPNQQTAFTSKAGSIAPSVMDSVSDWTLQPVPAAAKTRKLGATPLEESAEIAFQLGRQDPASGQGNDHLYPTKSTLNSAVAVQQPSQLPVMAPAHVQQQRPLYVPESSVGSQGPSVCHNESGRKAAQSAGRAQELSGPAPDLAGGGEDDGNNLQVSSKFMLPCM